MIGSIFQNAKLGVSLGDIYEYFYRARVLGQDVLVESG